MFEREWRVKSWKLQIKFIPYLYAYTCHCDLFGFSKCIVVSMVMAASGRDIYQDEIRQSGILKKQVLFNLTNIYWKRCTNVYKVDVRGSKCFF